MGVVEIVVVVITAVVVERKGVVDVEGSISCAL